MPLPPRILAILITLLLLVAGGLVGWSFSRNIAHSGRFAHQSTALRIEQIQRLSELVVLRVPISDVQVARLEGYTGSVRAVLIIKGDVQIATDLSQAKILELDPATQTARLLLPAPQAARPRLDHQGTRIYRVDRSGLWALYPGQAAEGAVIERAMRQAQDYLLQAAEQPEWIELARHQAQTVVTHFCQALGWQVEVVFEKR